MPVGVPDFAVYDPGADTSENGQRAQGVPFAVIHRTQGTDSRGLGKHRHHETPGTFNFLIRGGVLYCYYPAHVRCSHAAGGNDGVGIEIEGYDGQPVSAVDLAMLGRLAHWLSDTYGIPLSYYDGARRQIDDSGFRGFVSHASISTQPQWQHHDNITAAEWVQAIEADVPISLKEFQAIDNIVKKYVDPLNAKVDALAAAQGVQTKTLTDSLAAWFKKVFPNRANRP